MKPRATFTHGADPLPTGGRRVSAQVVEGASYTDGDTPVFLDKIDGTQLHDYLTKNGVEPNALDDSQRLRLVSKIDAMLRHLKAAKAASDAVQALLAEFRASG